MPPMPYTKPLAMLYSCLADLATATKFLVGALTELTIQIINEIGKKVSKSSHGKSLKYKSKSSALIDSSNFMPLSTPCCCKVNTNRSNL